MDINKSPDRRLRDTDGLVCNTPGHMPGSICVMVESEGKKVLFGQDLHGLADPWFSR